MNACVTCPSAMTDGAARLLEVVLRDGGEGLGGREKRVFADALGRLTSRDPKRAWTSGQWMTERKGGSDVKGTETQAERVSGGGGGSESDSVGTEEVDADGLPLGPYVLNGFKWFSSATDSNMTVLLAKEPSGAISSFFAPMRRRSSSPSSSFSPITNTTTTPTTSTATHQLNGISIQRLKPKLGTRALPTAELVLSNTRAYRIGAPGTGIKQISTVLNITRVHNAVTAVGYWGRGLSVSRAFAKVRVASGRLLVDTPQHVSTLADQHVRYRAMMHLAFLAVALVGLVENPGSSFSSSSSSSTTAGQPHSQTNDPSPASRLLNRTNAAPLLRIVTPLAKMLTARAAIAGLAECMESLGGVGYLENEDGSFNVARLFRDANVLSIWEGTTNIMAGDVVRVVKGGSTGDAVLCALEDLVREAVRGWRTRRRGFASKDKDDTEEVVTILEAEWKAWKHDVQNKDREELLFDGRKVAGDLGWIACAVMLGEDALSDGDAVSEEVWRRWMAQKARKGGKRERRWKETAAWDRRIVFGDQENKDDRAKL